jgi:hypothetical protein
MRWETETGILVHFTHGGIAPHNFAAQSGWGDGDFVVGVGVFCDAIVVRMDVRLAWGVVLTVSASTFVCARDPKHIALAIALLAAGLLALTAANVGIELDLLSEGAGVAWHDLIMSSLALLWFGTFVLAIRAITIGPTKLAITETITIPET